MGNRFYMQQKKAMGTRWKADGSGKAKRRLKKDVIEEVTSLLDVQVDGLDKCTVATLESLVQAISSRQKEIDAGYTIDVMARALTGAD